MARTVRPGYLDEDKFERSKRMDWFDLEKIQEAKVLVVGCGAIGNETVKNLILAGFRRIMLVDMDHVVRSNLNRCIFFNDDDAENRRLKAEVVAEKAEKMEKDLEIEYRTEMIEELHEDFIGSYDIVLGCLDNVSARLHLNAHCYFRGIPYVDAATLGFIGKVQVVLPPETPCFECGVNKTHLKIMEDRFSCTGVETTYHEPKLAAEITTTSIVSAVQTREAIKIVLGLEPDLVRNVFYYDGMRNVSEILEMDRNPECPHHVHETKAVKPNRRS
ncbi:MAG: ThiF family adenylyltransferase [Thermoplasmata archaeon]|nr:ThiF family adenylyltransferase [Thermoplasmata archaeon]